jgi:uncharacterized protein (TIGR02147 family)
MYSFTIRSWFQPGAFAMESIYKYSDYRSVIKMRLAFLKKRSGKGYSMDALAKYCRLQRTYLSAVLHGRGDLNADQIFMTCQFLEISEDEYRYTSLLHEWERSAFSERKIVLEKEINKIQKAQRQSERHLTSAVQESDHDLSDYYLNFAARLVHVCLTVENFRRTPEKIPARIGISRHAFDKAIKILATAGLIQIDATGIRVLKDSVHLAETSRYFPQYRLQMLSQAMTRLERDGNDQRISFSVLFSADAKARDLIHDLFLEFISNAQKISEKSDMDSVYQINFDFLKWA